MPCGPSRYLTLAIVIGVSCSPLRTPKDTPSPSVLDGLKQQDGTRVPAVLSSETNYDHFEGVAFRNGCDEDLACHVTGCSSEICSADSDVSSACVEYPDKPKAAACGCLKGQCSWYVTGAAGEAMIEKIKANAEKTPAEPKGPRRKPDPGPRSTLPEQSQPCADGRCAPGLECVTFFGTGGPKSGTENSCEIVCGGGRPCPRAQTCVSIPDGPGSVCRDDSTLPPPPKS